MTQEYKFFMREVKSDTILDAERDATEKYGKQGYKLFSADVMAPSYSSVDKVQVIGFQIVMVFVRETCEDKCDTPDVEAIQRHRGRPPKVVETSPVA